MTGPPTPPGDLYGCETKGVAGKAIRKNMKTKGEPIGFATNAGKPEARRGYTPVVTELGLPQTQGNQKRAEGTPPW